MAMAEPSENLYIQGLPLESTDDTLRAIFQQYGNVISVKVLPPAPGKNGRVGLLRMSTVDEARWLVDNVNQNVPMGLTTPVNVQFAMNRAQKDVDSRKAMGIPPPGQAQGGMGMGGMGGAGMGMGMGMGMPQQGFPPQGGGGGLLQTGVLMTGSVKRWDTAKGFGFIVPDGGGPDVFVHVKDLSDGETLVNGSQVTFEAVADPAKGPGRYRCKTCIGAVPKEQAAQAMASDRLFMKGLPPDVTEEQIMQIFGQYGTVASCKKLPMQAGRSDAACLVQMADIGQAKWLVDNVNNNIPAGLSSPLSITFAENKQGAPQAPMDPAAGQMPGQMPIAGLDAGPFGKIPTPGLGTAAAVGPY